MKWLGLLKHNNILNRLYHPETNSGQVMTIKNTKTPL